MDATQTPSVVLVHDWLTGLRGGEKCLEPLCRRWPHAKLLTLLHRRGSVPATIEDRDIRTSFLQWLPGVSRYYRYLLPLMPLAARTLRTGPCELVVSFSHCVAKSVRPPQGVPHVSYCFTPMRYAWHLKQSYFGTGHGLKHRLIDQLMTRLREWDRATASRVTHFLANSRTVQARIAECYGRDSTVVYPPVDTDFYTPDASVPREDFYLCVSAFAPYKRFDLAVEACNRLKRPLVLIGTGQDAARLKALAGPTVRFLGWQSDDAIRDHLRRCRALLFPGEEDFGIVPLEAMACGAAVIGFGRGGVTETVCDVSSVAPTGLLFQEQSVECLVEALERFERLADTFDPASARRQAVRFNPRRYAIEFFGHLDRVLGTSRQLRRAA